MSRLQTALTRITLGEHARDMASRVFFALFSWMWVLQIIAPWWDVWQSESWAVRIVVTALTGIFIGAYTYTILRINFGRRSWLEIFTGRERWTLRVVTAAISTILVLWLGDGWALSLIFVAVVAILTSPPLRAQMTVILVLGFIAAVLVLGRVELQVLVSVLMLSGVLGLLIAAQLRQGGMLGEMIESRYREVRVAAAEERLRIARDLHDGLGHSLSLITLKSELASKLAENDPARARLEMRQVEELARSAMGDVRRTVAEERRPILTSEIEDARELLDAAGIALHVEGDDTALPDEVSTLFAWGVREGVTNVVRHSRARHCRISVSRREDCAILMVLDDGDVSGTGFPRVGTGLASLRERVEPLGGRVRFGAGPDGGGHRLCLEVPIPVMEPDA